MEIMVSIANTNVTITEDNQRARDEPRNKSIWGEGVRQWSDNKRNKRKLLRVTRESLKSIVLEIQPDLVETPTQIELNPIPPETHWLSNSIV